MSTPKFISVLSCVALLACASAFGQSAPAAVGVETAFSADGLATVKLDGKVVSQGKVPQAVTVRFRDPNLKVPMVGLNGKNDGTTLGDTKTIEYTFYAAAKTLSQKYPWGQVTWVFAPAADRLDCAITVHNTSTDILSEFVSRIMSFDLDDNSKPAPVSEATYFGNTIGARSADSFSGPVVLPILSGTRAVVACASDANGYISLRWDSPDRPARPKETGKHGDPEAQRLADQAAAREGLGGAEEGRKWTLSVRVGGDNLLYDHIYTSRPIAPGGTDTYLVSIRFGQADAPLAPAADALAAYAQRHPMLLKWDDRRPILRTFIGDWFPFHAPLDANMPKPTGIETTADFKKRILQSADWLIESLKAGDAQGMIIWNVEGSTDFSIKYVGDPRMVEFMSPEMDQVADEYFKKIRDAGFRTGVCLRPSTIKAFQREDKTFGYRHTYPRDKDVVEVLHSKIEYAQKRWGCTLFYIDTNSTYRNPVSDEEKADWPKDPNGRYILYAALMSAEEWMTLCRMHPDVMLIPEHTPILCYTASVPYDQMNMGQAAPAGVTPEIVRATWPTAFKMLCGDTPQDRYWEPAVKCFLQGDVISVNAPLEANGLALSYARDEAAFRKAGAPGEIDSLPADKLVDAALDGSGDRRTRYFAAWKYSQMPPEARASEQIARLLDANDWLVRRCAIADVCTQDHLSLTAKLLAMSLDQKPSLGPSVEAAFKRIGAPAVPALLEAACVPSAAKPNAGGAAAALALGQIADPSARDALVTIIKDSQAGMNVRQAAVGALAAEARGPDKKAVQDLLVGLLDDAAMRITVAGALGRLEDKNVDAALKASMDKEAAKAEPDKKFIDAIEKILASRKK